MTSLSNSVKSEIYPSGILKVTLNRPEALNALNADVLLHLQDIFISAKTNYQIKAILLTGEGKAFCAGADIHQLSTLNGQTGLQFSKHGQHVFHLLEQLGKPSLAAIQGFALGGGCELAMAASIRIASSEAKFGQPEAKLGIIPGFGGTQRLSRLIGKGRAMDLCLTGRMITAEEALQFGLITEVTTTSDLMTRAESILTGLTKLPPLALKSMMAVIHQGYDLTLEDALAFEAAHFGLCCTTRDKHEGVNAFLEKRAAEFIGE